MLLMYKLGARTEGFSQAKILEAVQMSWTVKNKLITKTNILEQILFNCNMVEVHVSNE